MRFWLKHFIVSAIGVYVTLLLWYWWTFFRDKNEEITFKNAMKQEKKIPNGLRWNEYSLSGIFNDDKWMPNRRQRCEKKNYADVIAITKQSVIVIMGGQKQFFPHFFQSWNTPLYILYNCTIYRIFTLSQSFFVTNEKDSTSISLKLIKTWTRNKNCTVAYSGQMGKMQCSKETKWSRPNI